MTNSRLAPWLSASRWPTAPIRLVARLGSGHTPSRSKPEYWQDCTVPWITLADVWQLRNGQTDVIRETKEKISQLGLANSSAEKHPEGTVILSRTASVGFSAIMGSAMATSQDFATWTCGPRLESRYLLHALRGMAPDLKRVATGSTHKTIYMPDIEQLRVPLPPLEEQRRIADFLDAEIARIDALRRARESQLRCLKELWQAQLAAKVEELITAHGLVPLRRVVTLVEQGWSPQCDDVEAVPSEWAVMKTSAVSSGTFEPLQHKRLPGGIQPELRYQIKDGDVLMTRGSGSPAHVGVAALARTENRRLLLSDLLYRVRVGGAWSPEFLVLLLSSNPVRGRMSLLFRGQSGQTIKLRVEDIKSIEVPPVPAGVQDVVTREMNEAHARISETRHVLHSSLELLTERRQSLITAAVTGQFDVSTASGRNVTE
ncbi:restriction endonuclease subunit S [Streptomyces californicus]